MCTQLAMLNLLLQRREVSPKGITIVRLSSPWTTSLAVWSVALWVRANWLAFVYRHLMAFASAATLVIYLVIWPVGPFCNNSIMCMSFGMCFFCFSSVCLYGIDA